MKAKYEIRGLRETMRALNRMEADTKDTVRDALKKAADPIAKDAQARLARYEGASTKTIGPRVVTSGVFVTQRARKRTGLRPDFGALQMTRGLLPALEENEDNVFDEVEDAVELLGRKAGF